MQEVSEKSKKHGIIEIRDLAYTLSYAAASFQDGHTCVDWWKLRQELLTPNERSAAGIRFPPFLIKFINGRFYVEKAVQKDLNGLELEAIAGTPILQFVKPILDRHAGETLAFRASSSFNKWWGQEFWWFFTDVLPHAKDITMTFKRRDGSKIERVLSTIDFNAFHALAKASDQAASQEGYGTRVTFLDDGQVALLSYPQFTWSQEEKNTLDRIFQGVKDRRARVLLLDMRGNDGGDSRMGDFIMKYLTAKKFNTFSKMQVKISQQLLDRPDRCRFGDDCATLSPSKGSLITRQFEEEAPENPAAPFHGRTYLLVDNGTFSSASDFAAMFRDYGVGDIVGFQTGNPPIHFGDLFDLTLKNSGIPYRVSYKKFYNPRPGPGDDEHGVIPNILVTDQILNKYRGEKDPVLAFTLDYIKRQGTK